MDGSILYDIIAFGYDLTNEIFKHFGLDYHKQRVIYGLVELQKLTISHWRYIRDRLVTKKQWKSANFMKEYWKKKSSTYRRINNRTEYKDIKTI